MKSIYKDTKFTFKRYEKKYVLTPSQYEAFFSVAREHLVPDAFHESLVMSVYYDDDTFSLIRHSLDKPVFKEKLRIRSYGVPSDDSRVFVELKKKYRGVVYKRRVETTAKEAEDWLAGRIAAPEDSQTTREIDYFLSTNSYKPKVSISCDRTSWVDSDDPELRFTFDRSIRWRADDLFLQSGDYGEELLKDRNILMEIKIPSAAPIWLARLLSDEEIFPTSFSKYGTCYQEELIKGV